MSNDGIIKNTINYLLRKKNKEFKFSIFEICKNNLNDLIDSNVSTLSMENVTKQKVDDKSMNY